MFTIKFLWPSTIAQSKNCFPLFVSLWQYNMENHIDMHYTLDVYNQTIYSNIQWHYMMFFKHYYIQKRWHIPLKEVFYTDIYIYTRTTSNIHIHFMDIVWCVRLLHHLIKVLKCIISFIDLLFYTYGQFRVTN